MASVLQLDSDQRFKRHQYLARAGECQRQIYRLEEGWACRFRLMRDGRRQIVGLFLPGELCEPQWLLSPQADLPVVALTAVRTRAIPLPQSEPPRRDWSQPIVESVLVSINRQAEWIVSLGRRSATERLCALIHDIFGRLRANGRIIDDHCALPLTQYDLADIVGLTPVHVNRVLKTLRTRGVIDLRRNALRVPDPAALLKLAGE